MNITKVIRMDIWDLLEHLMKKKIIKGYVLYKTTPQQEKITHEEKESIIQLMWQQYMPAF